MLIRLDEEFKEKKISRFDESIVGYINQVGPIIVTMSVKEIAERCYTTNSSISKLIRKLGFDDITSFRKFVFHRTYRKINRLKTQDKTQIIYPIVATHDHLMDSSFTLWNKMLKRNKKITIITGTSLVPLVSYFSLMLNRMGFNSSYSEIQDVKASEVNKGLVVFVSNSGVNRGLNSLYNLLEPNIDDFMAITTTNVCTIKDHMNLHIHGRGIVYLDESEYQFPIKGSLVLHLLFSELIGKIEK